MAMSTTSSSLVSIFFVLITTVCSLSDALRCYTCTYVSTSSDTSCINNPDAVIGAKFTNCAKKYCVIQRQELQNPPGVINTFLRGCEDKPLFLNNVVEDPTYKTFYRSCTTDLCNTGDGIRSSGTSLDPDQGAGNNMIIPGRSGARSFRWSDAGGGLMVFVYIVSGVAGYLVSNTFWLR